MEQENKYYWIKLKTDFFSSDQIDFLMAQENGCKYVVLYQMLCLKTANNGGEMSSKIGEIIIPYDVNKISRDTKYFDIDTVRIALELFKQLGLVYIQENNILRIANFDRVVGSESASREAIKKREQRLKKKAIEYSRDNVGDISGDKLGTNCPIEYRDKSIDIRDKNIELEKKELNKEIVINNNKEISENKTLQCNANVTSCNTNVTSTLTDAQEIQKIIDDNFKYNNELYEAYNEFNKMRSKNKKVSNTPYANKKIINELNKMTDDDEEKIAIINQSIINGWGGIFPVKKSNYNNSYNNNRPSTIAGASTSKSNFKVELPKMSDEELHKYDGMSDDDFNF